MTVRAALLSLSMNQSIKYPDILGAVLYREKNLTKFCSAWRYFTIMSSPAVVWCDLPRPVSA